MELSDYVRILRAHIWAIIGLIVIGGVVAGAVSLLQPKVYAANASVFVTAGQTDNLAMASAGDVYARSRATTYVDIAKSRATANKVIERLNLNSEPGALIQKVQVAQAVDTSVIKITARAGTAQAAQDLADAWVQALIDQIKETELIGDTQETTGQNTGNSPVLRVIPVESAALPGAPVEPRTKLNIVLGLLIGAAAGIAYAVVRHYLDRRLRTADEVEKLFQVPVVGRIPVDENIVKAGKEDRIHIEAGGKGSSRVGEAYRKLRTNLQFMDVDNPPRVITVSSPNPNDGKSTIAGNLAVALAESGQNVVLVEGDLRLPTVGKTFNLENDLGVTDVLAGRVPTEDVIQFRPEWPNLAFITSGEIPPNPSELLGSERMRRFLNDLATDALVIVDGPPLLPVTDSAVLAAITDGALVLISYGQTKREEIGAAIKTLDSVNGRVLGVVINKVPLKSNDSLYAYDYKYYSSNGQDDKPAKRSLFKPKEPVG